MSPMITDDGLEGSGDIQPQDVGGADDDYARPFGVPETKEEMLGFKDPRVIEPPPWDTVRPSKFTRMKNWARHHLNWPWL